MSVDSYMPSVEPLTHLLTQAALTLSRVLFLRRGLRLGWRHQFARVSASFVRATTCGSLLRSLLQKERRAALWTFFVDWFVPVNRFTLRIFRAAVEGFAALRSVADSFAL